MASLNRSYFGRSCRIHLLLVGLLVLSPEAGSTCPAVCRCSGQSVFCGTKNFSSIPVGLPADIRTLRLEYNNLTKLAAGDFSSLPQLEKLHLYNNRIRVIEDGALRGLTRLTLLNLESNNISSLTNSTFEGANNLEELLLRNNHLSSLTGSVFNQIPHLRELDLASNDIEEFPTDVSRDLINVEILDLSYNPANLLLTPIFGQMAALLDLKLNYLFTANNAPVEDSISDSAFDGLSNLRNLELNGNRLTKIPSAVKTLSNLSSISLHRNSIQSVNADDFHQPSLLQFLNLEYNSVITFALAAFPHLTDLYLNYNPIPVIPSLAFSHNLRLATLHMAYTNLRTIEKDAFVGLSQLNMLYLQGNNLTTIVEGVMNPVNPNVNLDLSGNPLRCDCHLRGFAAWLENNHTGQLYQSSSLQCVTPDRLYGTPVTNLLPTQFACEPRSTSPDATISVAPGTEVFLPCDIQADPLQHIHWITSSHQEIYPDQPQPPFALVENGSLLITNVSLSNEGRYTCVVRNDAGEAQRAVILQVPSNDPTFWPTTKHGSFETTTAAFGGLLPTNPGNSGLVLGIAAIVLVIVLALIIMAALVVKRRNRKSRLAPRDIPLPPLPPIEIGGQTNKTASNPCSFLEESEYAEIPTHGITCDSSGYSTRISDPGVEKSSTDVDHTYFSQINDSAISQCDQGLKEEALTVKIPNNEYSAPPTSSSNDEYMTMKPLTE